VNQNQIRGGEQRTKRRGDVATQGPFLEDCETMKKKKKDLAEREKVADVQKNPSEVLERKKRGAELSGMRDPWKKKRVKKMEEGTVKRGGRVREPFLLTKNERKRSRHANM